LEMTMMVLFMSNMREGIEAQPVNLHASGGER
jgi:hypothetical protein